MPFRFPKIKNENIPNYSIPKPPKEDDELLTGFVQGLKASDIEERFARSLDKIGASYSFRTQIINAGGTPIIASKSMRNVQGAIEIDFIVDDAGVPIPFDIDGEFSHKGAEQLAKDKENDNKINDLIKSWNAMPMVRVPYWHLSSQELSDGYVRENVR